MKNDGLKEVLTGFQKYKEHNCHINRFATPGCAKVTTDTEKVLTLYDLNGGIKRECRVMDIVRCKDDDNVYIFHIIYTDDESEYYYAIIGVSDKNHEGIDVSDKSLEEYGIHYTNSFDCVFMTKRDRDYYLNMTWPKFIDADEGVYIRYINHIDKDHAIYSIEWTDGSNNLHEHQIVLSNEDKFELLLNPYEFASSIQDALLSCHDLIDYEEEE